MSIDMFRWEDGGALVHHCPQCKTPLSNKRAQLRCLGHHVEWCKKYHCQLFKAGGSAVCMACINSAEQRNKRYREIAEILRDLQVGEDEEEASSVKSPAAMRFDHGILAGGASKKDRKVAKKAAKAAERAPLLGSKDVERIGQALHPDEQDDEEFERALLLDKGIKDNVYYHPGTANSYEMRHRFIDAERAARSDSKMSEEELERILDELEAPKAAQVKGKKERALHGKLCKKIVEDFVHDHREDQETMAGFWRWANRKAYNRLIANGRIWDWKNGDALALVAEQDVEQDAQAGAEGEEGDGPEPGAEPDGVDAQQDAAVDQVGVPVTPSDHSGNDNDVVADDLMSIVSGASEISRSDRTSGSSVSRDTSASSTTRTTASGTEENAEAGWNTVGTPKPTGPPFTLKLSTNGGLDHLKANTPRSPWRRPGAPTGFSALSIKDAEDDVSELSSRMPRAKRFGEV